MFKLHSYTFRTVNRCACGWSVILYTYHNARFEIVLLGLLHKKLKNKKRKQKFWIHSLLNASQERGVFYTAFTDLGNDESKFFFNYFRMSIVSFDELLQHIKNDISAIKSSVSKL
jgi:hypothetical protein